MSVKEDLTSLLEQSRGEFVSGEEIAQRLGCTRGAVWKAVRSLQDRGFSIEAVKNRGYRLASDCDLLTAEGVKKYLESGAGADVEVFDCVDSTNNVVRRYASEGAQEGKVVIAQRQTGGKGRLGRSFYSPPQTGLYMSFLLKPDMQVSQAVRITTCAALAVCDAVEQTTGQKPAIKWVNDVYLNGKKICGILTEASLSLENGGVDYAVLGIGVNVYEPEEGFPAEIRDIAGAACANRQADLRNKLAAGIINSFSHYYSDIRSGGFRDEYSRRLMWKGERILMINGSRKTPCILVDVDDECRLEVVLENGEHKLISSGEISIRLNSSSEV